MTQVPRFSAVFGCPARHGISGGKAGMPWQWLYDVRRQGDSSASDFKSLRDFTSAENPLRYSCVSLIRLRRPLRAANHLHQWPPRSHPQLSQDFRAPCSPVFVSCSQRSCCRCRSLFSGWGRRLCCARRMSPLPAIHHGAGRRKSPSSSTPSRRCRCSPPCASTRWRRKRPTRPRPLPRPLSRCRHPQHP